MLFSAQQRAYNCLLWCSGQSSPAVTHWSIVYRPVCKWILFNGLSNVLYPESPSPNWLRIRANIRTDVCLSNCYEPQGKFKRWRGQQHQGTTVWGAKCIATLPSSEASESGPKRSTGLIYMTSNLSSMQMPMFLQASWIVNALLGIEVSIRLAKLGKNPTTLLNGMLVPVGAELANDNLQLSQASIIQDGKKGKRKISALQTPWRSYTMKKML